MDNATTVIPSYPKCHRSWGWNQNWWRAGHHSDGWASPANRTNRAHWTDWASRAILCRREDIGELVGKATKHGWRQRIPTERREIVDLVADSTGCADGEGRVAWADRDHRASGTDGECRASRISFSKAKEEEESSTDATTKCKVVSFDAEDAAENVARVEFVITYLRITFSNHVRHEESNEDKVRSLVRRSSS